METERIGFGGVAWVGVWEAWVLRPWARLGSLGAPGAASGEPGCRVWEVRGHREQLICCVFGYL